MKVSINLSTLNQQNSTDDEQKRDIIELQNGSYWKLISNGDVLEERVKYFSTIADLAEVVYKYFIRPNLVSELLSVRGIAECKDEEYRDAIIRYSKIRYE